MIKNFLFVLKRFKTSSLLNILGLSVAFTVFIIIMMQADFDAAFDKSIKDSDKIYRVDIRTGPSDKQAIVCRPLAEAIFESSPHIVAGVFNRNGAVVSGGSAESDEGVEW